VCCTHTFAPGSEECDWCQHAEECGDHLMNVK
jgi:hypothetical protein